MVKKVIEKKTIIYFVLQLQPQTQREIYTIIYDIACHIYQVQRIQNNTRHQCSFQIITHKNIRQEINFTVLYPLQYEQNANGECDTDDDDEEMLYDEEYNNF
ncbi:hypothetical protein ACTFIW_002407 [Dictyostelium discoideum]